MIIIGNNNKNKRSIIIAIFEGIFKIHLNKKDPIRDNKIIEPIAPKINTGGKSCHISYNNSPIIVRGFIIGHIISLFEIILNSYGVLSSLVAYSPHDFWYNVPK